MATTKNVQQNGTDSNNGNNSTNANRAAQNNLTGNGGQSGQEQANGITGDNTVKDPDNWTTGDQPMTGAQNSYLHTLASEAGEEVCEDLTKAEASKKIDELQQKTGRGVNQGS